MTKRVLIADDHDSWRELYIDLIHDKDPDVDIEEVETGKDLVACVKREHYDVIVSDNDMEEKGAGMKALQLIRKAGYHVPFYLVSADLKVLQSYFFVPNTQFNKGKFDDEQFVKDICNHLE